MNRVRRPESGQFGFTGDRFTSLSVDLRKMLDINPVQPSRTSERTINGPKTCFQTSPSNSVPNPAPISVPSDVPVCAESGISARALTSCQLDPARCGYGCAGGGCTESCIVY